MRIAIAAFMWIVVVRVTQIVNTEVYSDIHEHDIESSFNLNLTPFAKGVHFPIG